MKTNTTSNFGRLAAWLAWAAGAGMVAVILWTLPRGLDLMDEGYYLLEMRDVASWRLGLIPLMLRPLGIPETWLTYRVLRVALVFAGWAVFASGLVRYLRRSGAVERDGFADRLLWPVLFWGACVMQTVFPKTVSYNDLNSFLLMTGAGCLLHWLAGFGPAGAAADSPPSKAPPVVSTGCTLERLPETSADRYGAVASGGVLGLCLAVGYEVKFTSAILMAAGSVAVVLLCRRPSWRSRGVFLFGVLAGAGVGVWLMWKRIGGSVNLTVRSIKSVLGGAAETAAAPSVGDVAAAPSQAAVQKPEAEYYDARRMALWYVDQVKDILRLLFLRFVPVYPAAFAASVGVRKAGTSGKRGRLLWLMAAAGALGAMLLFLLAKGWRWHLMRSGNFQPRLGALYPYAILLLAGVAYALGHARWSWRNALRPLGPWVERVAVGGLLLALPFVAAVGSDFALVAAGVFVAAAWFGLLAWLAAGLERATRSPWASAGLLGLVGLFAFSHVFSGFVVDGFRLNSRARTQTVALDAGTPLAGLRVRPELAEGIRWVRGTLEDKCGFREGDPLLALYDMQGLVHAVGGRLVGRNWYSKREWKALDNARNIRAASQADLERAILLLNDAVQPEILNVLRARGMPFPESYTLVGEGRFPDPWTQGVTEFKSLSVWKPVGDSGIR